MNITVISASNRANSQSSKVASRIEQKLGNLGKEANVLDLHETKLPLFDDSGPPENWDEVQQLINQADGYVFVVPEWNGMVPPALINLLSYVEKKSMAHKPVLLVSLSSGLNGAYPLAQLRSFGQKNRHYVLMPDAVILKNVKSLLNNPEPDENMSGDSAVHERLNYELAILVRYAAALNGVRKDSFVDPSKYPNGV